MAKAKKRVAARKKSSKRGKASAKPAGKKTARRATPKRAKSKVRRAGTSATRPAAKKKRALKTAAKKAARKSPTQVGEVPATPNSPGRETERGEGAGPETEEK